MSVIHMCPPEGTGIMPCCGKTPFEVPSTDRMTLDAKQVSCSVPSDEAADTGGSSDG